jgi:hypothetical protein
MKKIETNHIVAGVRKLGLTKASFDHLQEAYQDIFDDVLQGILAGASGYTVLNGCVNSGSGATYNISAGAIYGAAQKEVYKIPAFSGTATGGNVPVLSIVTTYRAGDPTIYSDASSINTHAIVTLQWSFGASGSGLSDFSGLLTLKSRINSSLLDVPGQISTAVAALVNSSPSALDTLKELADALGDDANFAATMTTALAGKVAKAGDTMTGNLTVPDGTAAGHAVNKGQLDLKANKLQAAWTLITLASGWTAQVSGTEAKYRIDEFGIVNLKGAIKTTTSSQNYQWAAAGAVPSANTNSRVEIIKYYSAHGGGNAVGACKVVIEDNGACYIEIVPGSIPTTIDVSVSLEGISYWPQGS